MKKLLPFLLVIVLTNCEQKKELKRMNGAYLMQSQTLGDGANDSSINRKQLKIYTKDHVIYAAMRLPDSLASYAIGTYDILDGNVIEHFYFSSANGAQMDTFTLKVDQSDTGYKQVIKDLTSQGKKYTLTEQYKSIGTSDSTALDGAWKQSQNYFIDKKGDTSTNRDITEFKVYQSGNFIWASTYPDSTKKLLTFFGYGKFQMVGNNQSKEVNTLSTYPPIIDSTFNIELEIMGNDKYKQTIVQPGGKSIEIYERLKRY